MKVILLTILCLTMSGCGLLNYAPDQRNIKTELNILGCTWKWESEAKAINNNVDTYDMIDKQ